MTKRNSEIYKYLIDKAGAGAYLTSEEMEWADAYKSEEIKRQKFIEAIKPCFPNKTVEYDENGIVQIR